MSRYLTLDEDWIDISAYGDQGPTFLVNVYGRPIVTFPVRLSRVVELWSDWEWIA